MPEIGSLDDSREVKTHYLKSVKLKGLNKFYSSKILWAVANLLLMTLKCLITHFRVGLHGWLNY